MGAQRWEWKSNHETTTFYADHLPIGIILPFTHDHITATDELTQIGAGVFSWVRHFQVSSSSINVRLLMEFRVPRPMTYGLIPSVSYNGNPWGPGQDVKGFTVDGEPWTFAYHRVAVCGATYSENDDWSVALFAAEGFTGSCSLHPADQQVTHRLLWPEVETPRVYSARDQYAAAYETAAALEAGAVISLRAYLVFTSVQEPRQAWRTMLDIAWQQHEYQHQPRFTCEELWNWGIQYATESLWAEERHFKGFSIGLAWEDHDWSQSPDMKYEIGWCGQNASLANALLFDYLRSGNQASLDKGLAALDSWAAYAPLANGLFCCHFDPLIGLEHPKDNLQDGCNLGGAATYFFEAHELAARCGVERPGYQTLAFGICDFFVKHQFEDGNLGRAWHNDGTCAATDGTTGCFLVPPLLTAFQLSGQDEYLTAAKRAFAFYMAGLIKHGFTAAGALDTHCIDKESAIPLLRSALMLYRLTGEAEYLQHAVHAAYYLASWQWQHTVHYAPGTALAELAYDTFGGTSVSTQHHHIDPYALSFLDAWLQLADLTGNLVWKQRAQAVWSNGMLGISDGQLRVMGKLRPVGSQDEGFYHTRWGNPFNVSQWLVAWPTAFRLEVLRSLTDWSLLDAAKP